MFICVVGGIRRQVYAPNNLVFVEKEEKRAVVEEGGGGGGDKQ